jgi:hypothetical protein
MTLIGTQMEMEPAAPGLSLPYFATRASNDEESSALKKVGEANPVIPVGT